MKKSLMFLSILIVSFIAIFDAKDRIKELDEVAANTPAQVEMNQSIQKPNAQIKYNTNDIKKNLIQNSDSANQKIMQDKKLLQNNVNNVDKRRNTISNPVN